MNEVTRILGMSACYLKRFEAVFLCSHPKGPKMSSVAAAKYIKKSKSFVKKWVNHYSLHKNVDDLPDRGITRTSTRRQDSVIIQLFEENHSLTLDQAVKKLAKKNIHLSVSTVRNRLQENGIAYRNTMVKPLLTAKHVEKRLQWANEHLNKDWTNVVFTDESSFWTFNTKRRAWSNSKQKVIVRTVKHPAKVHVWGCFNKRGFGKLFVFTRNLDAAFMNKIYSRALLPSAKKWFGTGNSNWTLQEDNDPKHRSRLCTEWKFQNNVETLDWPSQSPDANPIENVWAVMKFKLKKYKIKNQKHLARILKKIWSELRQEYAVNLVESMDSRCTAIIENGGDWTYY